MATARRRILLVGTYVTAAHTHSVGEDLAEQLQEAGWDVTMTSRATGRVSRMADMVATTWRARNDFDLAQVDVYSGNAFVWAEAVCTLLRTLDKPFILALRGGNLPGFSRNWPRRVQRLLHSAAVVTAPSRYLHEQMAAYRGDIRLLANPIDIGSCAFRLRTEASPRLIWIRAFHRIYNPELAAEVVALLRSDFPDIRLTMVGPDKDGGLARTRERAAELGVTDAIEFTGGVPHDCVPGLLQQSDVFINTTDVDNTPVSVLEAMACGLPVVSTNVGGLGYLLDHGHDALLVPPRAAAAMAASIGSVLRSPELTERLSRNGRAKVETMDWAVILPKWQAFLDEVWPRS